MDPNRDNPIIRFTTFWWAIGTFLIFALLLAVIALFNRKDPETLEDVAAKLRYETKAKVDKEQADALPKEKIDAAVSAVAKKLAASKPVAVEKPEQVVPGSPTAAKLAAAPPPDTSAMDKAPAEDTPIEPVVMEKGKTEFVTCSACHGANGEGGPLGPPLAGSEWVKGPISNLIRIQLRGLTNGPITVAGKDYATFPAPMAPLGAGKSDEDVAAVLTYVRNSFGNKASAVKPEQVKALRGEVGKPALTVNDLTKP